MKKALEALMIAAVMVAVVFVVIRKPEPPSMEVTRVVDERPDFDGFVITTEGGTVFVTMDDLAQAKCEQ
jgi:hypothetical protein